MAARFESKYSTRTLILYCVEQTNFISIANAIALCIVHLAMRGSIIQNYFRNNKSKNIPKYIRYVKAMKSNACLLLEKGYNLI